MIYMKKEKGKKTEDYRMDVVNGLYVLDLDEAIETLEGGMDVHVKVGNDQFVVGDMHGYIGAPENKKGFISEYLGNVYYESAKYILELTAEGMKETEGNEDEEVYFLADW